jgi:hypothetical protein
VAGVNKEEALNTIIQSVLEERVLVEDPEWDTFAMLVSIAPDVSEMTAFRYTGDGLGKPTPLRATRLNLFRDLQAATAAADGSQWEVCTIRIERDRREARVNFVYGEDAEQWRITPATFARIAEQLRE